ncbi:hypothetical protein [Nocardioides nanhaiensis]|uniref:DUF3040 domain-containing protein n=1 Tax=Nocardioides nanhaiensis TaxID=1476871 RepID=A0ABP8VQB0_9ACTN
MTDQPDQPDAAEPTGPGEPGEPAPLAPAREAQVRRLLGQARVDPATEGLPPQVASRLDATLADLVAHRGTDETTGQPTGQPPGRPTGQPASSSGAESVAPVRDLAHTRRRRGALLLAAAAVVVAGVGVSQVVDRGDDTGAGSVASESVDSGDGAQRRAEEGDTAAEAAPESAPGASGGDLDQGEGSESVPPPQAPSPTAVPDGPRVQPPPTAAAAPVAQVRVRSAQFVDDVRLLQRSLPRLDVARARLPRAAVPAPLRARRVVECRATVVGEGAALLVLLDSTPGLLVFRPASEDAQVVDLLQCGTGRTLRSTTLATPRS